MLNSSDASQSHNSTAWSLIVAGNRRKLCVLHLNPFRSRHEVHKRITDSLQKQLEDEIRKLTSQEPLLNLLKSCWQYATVLPELRPILWAVLKQLGAQTPLAVLKALSEREKDGSLKHADIFRPLPPLLKRLVWEADWDDKVMNITEKQRGTSDDDPQEYLNLAKGTLLCQTVQEIIDSYCSNPALLESSGRPFVYSARGKMYFVPGNVRVSFLYP